MISGSLLRKITRRKARRRKVWRPPPLSIGQILDWADEHHARTGQWPNTTSGRTAGPDRMKWKTIDSALRMRCRGLTIKTSLSRLLYEQRGVGRLRDSSDLSVEQVLGWADAYHAQHGDWPTYQSGLVDGSPGNTWCGVNSALLNGFRGLPSGRSLASLLDDERGVRNIRNLPDLTIREILAWADAYYAEQGRWPDDDSGPIAESGGETWRAVVEALLGGKRGLKKSTLQQLLARHRGRRNHLQLQPYDVKTILRWADRYFARHGDWPTVRSGPIPGAPQETWFKVSTALSVGLRGLPKGSSLAKLLMKHRGARYDAHRPPLDPAAIRRWAAAYQKKHGKLPSRQSGPIPGSDGDTWRNVDLALRNGNRGLPGSSSLARFLNKPKRSKQQSSGGGTARPA
jgi:hypothetical protein